MLLSQNPEYRRRKEQEEEDVINPKLKIFYDQKTKVEPFYNGGKICVLSPCHFACQCGNTVKLISTVKTNLTDKSDSDNNDQVTSMEVDSNEDDHKKDYDSGFSVIKTFEEELDEIVTFDACPFSETLITAHKSSLLRVYDLNTNAVLKTVKSLNNLPVTTLEIHKLKSENDSQHNSEDEDQKPDVVDDEVSTTFQAAAGTMYHEEKIKKARSTLTWITVSGAVVKIWDAGGNQVSKAIHVDNVASLGFGKWDPVGKSNRVYVAERNIYVIDCDESVNRYGVSHVCEGHFSQVTGIEWSSNIMISGGRDKVVIMWDMSNDFKKLMTIPFPGSVESLSLLSDHDLYVALSPSQIRHFNIQTKRVSASSALNLGDHENVLSIYSPSSYKGHFFVSTHTSTIYHVRKSKSNDEDFLKIVGQYVGSLDEILSVALWKNDKIAVANNTSVVKVYSMLTGSCESFLHGHTDIVLTLAARDDWLASGAKDNKIILWKLGFDLPQAVLTGHIASVSAVCFSAVKMTIYSASEDTFLKAWDAKSCLQSAVAHEKEIHAVHCSPNGALLATASRDKSAKIWSSDTLSLISTLKGHKKSIWDVKFSLWDQLVATASADTTIKIWNVVSGTCVQTLQSHLSSVLQVAFSNKGLQILSTSSDGTLKSWDLKTSTCLSTKECSDDKVWAMDCNPDGSVVVTGAADASLIVWVDVTEDKVKDSIEKRKKFVENEQLLANVLSKNEWGEALRLSIELDKPFTLLRVVREVPDRKTLTTIVKNLSSDHKSSMMTYVRQWNTNTKTSTEAQILLNILFRTTPLADLHFLDVTALLPYTERHFNRAQTLLQHSAQLQYFADKEATFRCLMDEMRSCGIKRKTVEEES